MGCQSVTLEINKPQILIIYKLVIAAFLYVFCTMLSFWTPSYSQSKRKKFSYRGNFPIKHEIKTPTYSLNNPERQRDTANHQIRDGQICHKAVGMCSNPFVTKRESQQDQDISKQGQQANLRKVDKFQYFDCTLRVCEHGRRVTTQHGRGGCTCQGK